MLSVHATFAQPPKTSKTLTLPETSKVIAPPPTTLSERKAFALQIHIDKPFPSIKPCKPREAACSDSWGAFNLAFARLALHGPTNASIASEVSAEVEAWPTRFPIPWNNYSVKGPMAGLGELPILTRMALLPLTRDLLSTAAIDALDAIFMAWLSPRSKVAWASAPDSWVVTDGSENLDATRKACLYLSALALNISHAGKMLQLDGKTVAEHAAAWQVHWSLYFRHRAVEGLGVEMGSPTYNKYSVQNYLNLADLASPSLAALASDFLQLWFADAAQAFIPSTGLRGGAHNRVYRGQEFFSPEADSIIGFTWLYGWWETHDATMAGKAAATPQLTLFATSMWQPLGIITAIASSRDLAAFTYTSRRPGDVLQCTQHLGPVEKWAGMPYGNLTCTKTPCKPCVICGAEMIPALIGDECNTLAFPTTVVKLEHVGAGRRYTLGAIKLDQRPGTNYGADVGQNHQVGAFFGGRNTGEARLVFGDGGSTNCSEPAFQRHAFGSITSILVDGALAVARPLTAKINGCFPRYRNDKSCRVSDFPLFAFVSAKLYATRVAAGNTWQCFNAEDETYACVGMTGGKMLTPAPTPCTNGIPSSPAYWNGTLLLFNGSSTTTNIGVLQIGTMQEHGTFAHFVAMMKNKQITTTADGGLVYTTLQGQALDFGVGGAAPFKDLKDSYKSPYISAVHERNITVTLSAPGFDDATLRFNA